MVFETIGMSLGFGFVVVIAGASLIIAYYKKKGLITLQSPIKKTNKDEVKSDES